MSVLSGNSNTNLSTILYGTNKTVQEVYLGNALVWSAQSTSFSFSPTTLYNLSNDGGTVDITFTPGISDYVAGTWPAWVSSVTPTVVSGVTTKITVTYGENASTSTRDGNLTFFAGGENRTVPMSQQAADVTVTSELNFVGIGGTQKIYITGSFSSWRINSAPLWVDYASSTGTTSPIDITADSNTGSSRGGTISLTVDGHLYSVGVIQAAVEVHKFKINPTPSNATVLIDGQQRTNNEAYFAPTTVIPWSVSATGYETKTGQLTMGYTDYTMDVTLVAATYTLSVNPTSREFDYDEYSSSDGKSISITSNQSWTISVPTGFAISRSTSGSGNATFNVYPTSYNSGTTNKTGTLTITGNDSQYVDVPLTQKALIMTLDPTTLSVSASGGSYSVSVGDPNNYGWTISSNQSWCSVEPSSGTGNAIVAVGIGTNTSSSRSATITLASSTGDGTNLTCSVAQSAAQAITFSPSSVSFAGTGSEEVIGVNGTFDWWEVTSWPNWCTCEMTTGQSNNPILIEAGANTGSTTRTGSIVVSVDGTDYTISVSQEPVSTVIPVTGVSISPSTLSLVAGNSSTLTANVTPSNATDKSVTWSSSNTSVASVNEYGVVSAVGAGSVTITATSNYDSTKTGSCTLTVAAATLTVSPTTMSFTSRQGTSANGKDLTITANGGWNMSLSGSGFTTNQGTSYSGSGNAVISVYPTTLNNSSSSRSATITVTAYGPISRTVSVTQSGVETLDVTYNGSTATSLTFAATDDTYAEGKTIYVNSQNQGWTASISNGWTIYGDVTSGSGPTYLRVYPSSNNTGSTNKTGTLTIQGTVSGSVSVSLTQEGTLTIIKAVEDGYADNEIMQYGLATYTVSPLIPVNWSIDSGSNICSIDVEDGLAYVSITDGAEIGDQVTIRATSTADSTKYATLTITVVEEQPLIPDSIAIDTPPSGFEYENGYYFPRGGCRSATFTAETDPQGLGGLITWELRTTSGGTWTQTNKAYIQDSINGATGDVEGLLTVTSAATSWTPMRVYAISTVDNTVLDYITVIVFYA